MKPISNVICVSRRLLFAAFLFTTGISLTSAQTVQPSAADLAKYDKNKDGKLDADEQRAKEKDEAVIARANDKMEEVGPTVVLSPFEVVADEHGYYSANTTSGTRINAKLEDLGASITVITKK